MNIANQRLLKESLLENRQITTDTLGDGKLIKQTMKEDILINTIIAADTTKVLPELIKADTHYDLIIADPPYNIG